MTFTDPSAPWNDNDPSTPLTAARFTATINALGVWAEEVLGVLNALVYKGGKDCSANPNFPAANAGDTYLVTVAGKIGGASGYTVSVGDSLLCNTDGAAEGTKAAVGSKWDILDAQGTVIAAVAVEAEARAAADALKPNKTDIATVQASGAGSSSNETVDSSAETNRKVGVETTRAEGAEAGKASKGEVTTEKGRAEGAEATNATAISAETIRAKLAELDLYYPEPQVLMPKAEVFKNTSESTTEEVQMFGERFARDQAANSYLLSSGVPVGCSLYLPAGKTINGIAAFFLTADAETPTRTHAWVVMLNSERKKKAESLDYTSLTNTPFTANKLKGLKFTSPYTAGSTGELIYLVFNETMSAGKPATIDSKEVASALSGLVPVEGFTAGNSQTTPGEFGKEGAAVTLTGASKIPWLVAF